jgi:hypothetical protein
MYFLLCSLLFAFIQLFNNVKCLELRLEILTMVSD